MIAAKARGIYCRQLVFYALLQHTLVQDTQTSTNGNFIFERMKYCLFLKLFTPLHHETF